MADMHARSLMLLGPTASGKSALAMRLADALSIEIISVDSAQVYRGLDVGSAKPTADERARVPHHLIDIREPTEPYSAADFVRDARSAIAEVRARQRLPVLVGGTMLYAKALLEGLSNLPSADPELRADLAAEAKQAGWPALHARLSKLDPETAARLKPNDSQRVQRALEVCLLTERPMSALLADSRPIDEAISVIRLMPSDRAELHRRIAHRFDSMVSAGLLDETRRLRAYPGLSADAPSMRSVGYRQAWQHLDGEIDFDSFAAAGVAATRQLAKRQMTWLRSMPERPAIDPFDADAYATIETIARQITNSMR